MIKSDLTTRFEVKIYVGEVSKNNLIYSHEEAEIKITELEGLEYFLLNIVRADAFLSDLAPCEYIVSINKIIHDVVLNNESDDELKPRKL